MANNILIDIGARTTRLNRGLRRSQSQLLAWARRLTRRMVRAGMNMGRALMRGMRRGLTIVGGLGIAGVAKSIQEAGRFEQYGLQFEALIGSAKEAKKRMEDIKKIDLEVPFDITSIADASRILTVFTDNAFASTDALRMMADAASVTPNEIRDVAFWYGRAYSMIKAGRPFGEAAMRLQEMGLISGKTRNEFDKLSRQLKSAGPQPHLIARGIDLLNGEFLKFEGSASKLVKTWRGVTSVFSSGVKQSFAAVGDEILPLAKEYLQELIDKLQKLRDNGTLSRWGQNVAYYTQVARNAIETVAIPSLAKFSKKALEYFEEVNKSAKAQGWSKTISNEMEKALDVSLSLMIGWVERNSATIGAVGYDIGSAIIKGIARGIASSKTGNFITDRLTLGFSKSYRDIVELMENWDNAVLNPNMESDSMSAKNAILSATPEQRSSLMSYSSQMGGLTNDQIVTYLKQIANNTEKTEGSLT